MRLLLGLMDRVILSEWGFVSFSALVNYVIYSHFYSVTIMDGSVMVISPICINPLKSEYLSLSCAG